MLKKSRILVCALLVLTMVIMLIGCKTTKDDAMNGQTTAPTEAKTETTTETVTEEPIVEDGPFTKYDPEITMLWANSIDDVDEQTLNDLTAAGTGETIEDNRFTSLWKDRLGINIEYLWVAKGDEADKKMNLAIASGDLPDYFYASDTTLRDLAQNGMIADFTDIYETYASDALKEYMSFSDGMYVDYSTVDGKLCGIPQIQPATDNAAFLWIRTDWLDKLNLEAPKTMDDLYNVAVAFKENNPDNPNGADNYGLTLTSNLGDRDYRGIFWGFGAYPKYWVKDDSGQVVYGSIQPEMIDALKFLNRIYEEGLVHPEFGTHEMDQVFEMVNAGKLGLKFEAHYGSFFATAVPENFEGGTFDAYACPSVDGTGALQIVRPGTFGGVLVASSTAEHPEAIIKMANVWVEAYKNSEDQAYYWGIDEGIGNVWRLSELHILSPTANSDFYTRCSAAEASGDWSGLAAADKTNWEQDNWGVHVMLQTAFKVLAEDYVANNKLMANAYNGAATPTQSEKGALLKDLENEYMFKMILGELDVEAGFSEFVEKWKSLGGDQITQEINDVVGN